MATFCMGTVNRLFELHNKTYKNAKLFLNVYWNTKSIILNLKKTFYLWMSKHDFSFSVFRVSYEFKCHKTSRTIRNDVSSTPTEYSRRKCYWYPQKYEIFSLVP